MRFGFAVVVALLAIGCQSPPEDRCSVEPGEAAVEIDCPASENAEWGDRALDESREGFEDRSPPGRR
jgi:hypothetical protein